MDMRKTVETAANYIGTKMQADDDAQVIFDAADADKVNALLGELRAVCDREKRELTVVIAAISSLVAETVGNAAILSGDVSREGLIRLLNASTRVSHMVLAHSEDTIKTASAAYEAKKGGSDVQR